MRRGRVTAAGSCRGDIDPAELAPLMVGREVLEVLERAPFAPGPVVLALADVEADNDRGLPALRGVSLDVRAGEIVGHRRASPATARASSPQVITGAAAAAAGSVVVDGDGRRQPAGRARRSARASPTSPRTAPGSAPRRTCRSSTT